MSYRYAASQTGKWANKATGNWKIGDLVCRGYDFEDASGMDEGPCPPLTYNNFLWSIIIEPNMPSSSLWWNERRVCMALRKWARPAFGYATAYEAYAVAYRVPAASLPFSSLAFARAFRNFEDTSPPACYQRHAPYSPTGGQRWIFDRRAIFFDGSLGTFNKWASIGIKQAPSFAPYFQQLWNFNKKDMWPMTQVMKDNDAGRYTGNPPPDKIAYDAWRGNEFSKWSSDPYYKSKLDAALERMKISGDAEMMQFFGEARNLIMSVPGSEPEKNVRHVDELIQFGPGSVSINPWVVRFVQLFSDRAVSLQMLRKVAEQRRSLSPATVSALQAALPAGAPKRAPSSAASKK